MEEQNMIYGGKNKNRKLENGTEIWHKIQK